MADEEFKLPGSSLEEVEKVIEAYAQKTGTATNEELSKLTGMARTDVSRNNGFLSSVDLIQGGRYKEATELGRRLGLALHHQQVDEVRKYWQKAVAGSPFLSEQLTAIRVQKGIPQQDLAGKILYNSGATKNKNSEAGARAVGELLEKAGLITVADGKFVIATEPSHPPEVKGAPASDGVDPARESPVEPPVHVPAAPETQKPLQVGREQGFSLAVNLQLQLPEFEDPSKYEDLFKALRRYLLEPGDTA